MTKNYEQIWKDFRKMQEDNIRLLESEAEYTRNPFHNIKLIEQINMIRNLIGALDIFEEQYD